MKVVEEERGTVRAILQGVWFGRVSRFHGGPWVSTGPTVFKALLSSSLVLTIGSGFQYSNQTMPEGPFSQTEGGVGFQLWDL